MQMKKEMKEKKEKEMKEKNQNKKKKKKKKKKQKEKEKKMKEKKKKKEKKMNQNKKKKKQKKKVLKEIPLGGLRANETVQASLEARLLSRLHHPHILRFFHSFLEGDAFCIITEYCQRRAERRTFGTARSLMFRALPSA
ncbi:unnamed protein product [Arctogadus glacialis]